LTSQISKEEIVDRLEEEMRIKNINNVVEALVPDPTELYGLYDG
jgi:hypothetical protein